MPQQIALFIIIDELSTFWDFILIFCCDLNGLKYCISHVILCQMSVDILLEIELVLVRLTILVNSEEDCAISDSNILAILEQILLLVLFELLICDELMR